MDDIVIDGKTFKPYDNMYYVSCDGDVYSKYANKILKPGKDPNGYLRVDIHRKHKHIHTLVYQVWVGSIQPGEQINHYDDNKYNNNYLNLYKGSQKDNIADCFRNNHRVGHTHRLVVYDKKTDETLTFCPANKFIGYCGHTSTSGSLAKFFNKQWFNERYKVVEFCQVNTLSEMEGVTTIPDECKEVE